MNIAALSSTMPQMQMRGASEATEGPGPDHDGDSDDKGVGAATSSVTASPPQGTGQVVDTKA